MADALDLNRRDTAPSTTETKMSRRLSGTGAAANSSRSAELHLPMNVALRRFLKSAGRAQAAVAQQDERRAMERLRQKRLRLVLKPEDYEELRYQILNRDGWKCQCCGPHKDLHVHHLVRRSEFGSDALENLMTLCAGCHRRVHSPI
jgi:5-methylcytosine-specific restriction endonuclease McrA